MWKIVKNFVGTDLSKVCLPVVMCEPVNTLQKSAEIMINYNLLQEAVKDVTENTVEESCKRLALVSLMAINQYSTAASRFKKPFNPILGETYEFVQKDWRYMSEQVSHHPPITAYHCEGKGFSFSA